MMQGGVVAYFYYDSNNSVTAMSINDSMYYYVKNLQGDITKIVNESGNVLVEYTYDAWGKILNETSSGNGTYAHVKDFNPFRYRVVMCMIQIQVCTISKAVTMTQKPVDLLIPILL